MKRRKYDDEFKRDAVELVIRSGPRAGASAVAGGDSSPLGFDVFGCDVTGLLVTFGMPKVSRFLGIVIARYTGKSMACPTFMPSTGATGHLSALLTSGCLKVASRHASQDSCSSGPRCIGMS